MKKLFLSVSMLGLLATAANAQIKDTTYFKHGFEAGANINQTSFSDSWKFAQGGLNNFAISAFLFNKLEYVKVRHKFVSDLQLQYGRVITDGVQDYQGGNTWRKNVDRIFFDNIYTYAFSSTLGAFASATFNSQFDQGFKFDKTKGGNPNVKAGLDSAIQVSNFLAPGTLVEGLGVEWKPVTYFSVRAAPVAFRQRFSTDAVVTNNIANADGSHLGVAKGMTVKNDFGLNVVAKFDKDLVENINLKILGQYFSAYDNIAVGVVRFDAILTAKITKYINVNLTGVLFYDEKLVGKDTEGNVAPPKVQASQQLALGIVYKISNSK